MVKDDNTGEEYGAEETEQRLRNMMRDRAGLKTLADGLYGIPEAEYRRLIEGRAKNQ